MTLQQLEYILALDNTRHFVKAAELCGVTQPTLSAMIQKLEDELDCVIFDRTQHPIAPTVLGKRIIEQARVILFHGNQLKEMISMQKTGIGGKLHIGVIPTIAPYLLPKFIETMRIEYPKISLKISEMRTDFIIEKLKMAEIDMAILATPLLNPNLFEIPLYYEGFVGYVAPSDPLYECSSLTAQQLSSDRMWVLEEGHCLRNQVFNFCNQDPHSHDSVYEAGSIDTLVKIVDLIGGYTVIPELHIDLLTEQQRKNLRALVNPEATREISIIIRTDFVKEALLNAVANCIKRIIPEKMLDSRLKKFAIKL
ncbi:MAG: hydrogen peroxide-inducible genes activator [Prevotellaceae bacterium]|jgi:LysR family hydrogen peroxide-inducible transcriptional activator|nr:hydrogen peroxide-inducible genes activator [Prevotellaceae bacterium]